MDHERGCGMWHDGSTRREVLRWTGVAIAGTVVLRGPASALAGPRDTGNLTLVDISYLHLEDRFVATMSVNRGQYEAADTPPGRASLLELTVVLNDGRQQAIEPSCVPIAEAPPIAEPHGGTVLFRQDVPWDGRVGGTPVAGLVTVRWTAQLVSGHPVEHRPVGTPSSGEEQTSITADPVRAV